MLTCEAFAPCWSGCTLPAPAVQPHASSQQVHWPLDHHVPRQLRVRGKLTTEREPTRFLLRTVCIPSPLRPSEGRWSLPTIAPRCRPCHEDIMVHPSKLCGGLKRVSGLGGCRDAERGAGLHAGAGSLRRPSGGRAICRLRRLHGEAPACSGAVAPSRIVPQLQPYRSASAASFSGSEISAQYLACRLTESAQDELHFCKCCSASMLVSARMVPS